MKQIHIKLPAKLHTQLKIQAALEDKTIQVFVVEMITEKLAKNQALLHQFARSDDHEG